MIDGLKPYREMKDSGVEWLGAVPSHWGIQRIKTVFREKDERSGDGVGVLLSLTRARGLIPQVEASNRLASASDLSKYKVCGTGDLVMNRMQAWSGMFATSMQSGLVSPDYSVFGAAGVCSVKYFEHLFKTPVMVDRFAMASKGIGSGFNRLYTPDFGAEPIVVPPLDEQAAIVRFVDHADRRIRRAIAIKQKLIRLLEEQERAIIHRAVTRGLDPDVRLKPSGVEWLGDVPEHWVVMPLRRVSVSRCDGPFGSGLKSSHYVEDGVRVVRLQNIGHAEFKGSSAAYVSEAHYASLGDHSVLPGDILIAGLGDDRHPAGRACVAPLGIEPAMVKADCFRFRVDEGRLLPQFAALQLTATAVGASAALSTGATRQRTNLQSTAGRAIALPPVEEQRRIIERVTDAIMPILNARSILDGEMALLREYRIRLVADVVAGKLDVREAAAKLPELSEPMDSAFDTDESDEDSMEEDSPEDQAP